MPSLWGTRAGLSPTGHAAIDKPRFDFEKIIGTDPKTFHYARPKTFDETISGANKSLECANVTRVLQIQDDRPLSAIQQVPLSLAGSTIRLSPMHDYDVSAHISKHHSGERGWPKAFCFNDAQPLEHWFSPCLGKRAKQSF
jgi:hypothetical protein